jgi:GGDEF domain-containing protein
MSQHLPALECYTALLRGAAQFAPKLHENAAEEATPERGYLLAMAAEAESGDPELLNQSRSYLRCVLREYRDDSARYLKNLREQLAMNAGTLADLTRTLAEENAENTPLLRSSVEQLKQIAIASDRQPSSDAIRAVAAELESSIVEMLRQQLLIVGQLQTEIRLLHQRMDTLTSRGENDASQLMPREEMERRIAVSDAGSFRLLLMKADGLNRAAKRYPPEVCGEIATAFARRIHNHLPAGTRVARWSEEGFVALLVSEIGQARELALGLEKQLSGPYVCRCGPKSVMHRLHTTVEVLDGPATASNDNP